MNTDIAHYWAPLGLWALELHHFATAFLSTLWALHNNTSSFFLCKSPSIPPFFQICSHVWQRLPPYSSEVPANPDAVWRRANGRAFSDIFFRVSPEIQCNLSDTISAREAWLTLENLYLGPPLEKLFMLSHNFNRLSQKTNQSTIQFINTVITAATDLRQIGEDLPTRRNINPPPPRLQQQTISFPPIMDSAKPVLSSYNIREGLTPNCLKSGIDAWDMSTRNTWISSDSYLRAWNSVSPGNTSSTVKTTSKLSRDDKSAVFLLP